MALWAACKKAELPPSVSEDPVFTVQYASDPLSASVTAGLDDVYLFTDFASANNKLVCSGSFSKADCPGGNCPGTLAFEFQTLLDPFTPDSFFHLGAYTFVNQDSLTGISLLRATFFASNANGYNNFLWKINNQDAGVEQEIVVDFPNDVSVNRFVELIAKKPSGITSRAERWISVDNPGANLYPAVEMNIAFDTTGYTLTATPFGGPYQSLIWNTGDTSESFFSDFLDTFYRVEIANGPISSSASFFGISPNDLPLQSAGINYEVEEINIPAVPGEVSIQWIDSQGIIWRSDRGIQESSAFFTVAESASYHSNEKGQKTRKMRVLFDCTLYNDTGQGRLFSGSGVIAVAHP